MKLSRNAKVIFIVLVVTLGVFAFGDLTGKVINSSAFCGNSVCEVGENIVECPDDCKSICGDSICQSEEFLTCKEDCAGVTPQKLKYVSLRDGLFGKY